MLNPQVLAAEAQLSDLATRLEEAKAAAWAQYVRILGFRVEGFRALGFRVEGFRALGFRVEGFRALGFRVSGV